MKFSTLYLPQPEYNYVKCRHVLYDFLYYIVLCSAEYGNKLLNVAPVVMVHGSDDSIVFQPSFLFGCLLT